MIAILWPHVLNRKYLFLQSIRYYFIYMQKTYISDYKL